MAERLPGRATLLDAALAALSGRVRLEDGSAKSVEAILTELLDRLLAEPREPPNPPDPAARPARGGRGKVLEGSEAAAALREGARRTASRAELAAAYPELAGSAGGGAAGPRRRRRPGGARPGQGPRPRRRAGRRHRSSLQNPGQGSRPGCSCAPPGAAPAPGGVGRSARARPRRRRPTWSGRWSGPAGGGPATSAKLVCGAGNFRGGRSAADRRQRLDAGSGWPWRRGRLGGGARRRAAGRMRGGGLRRRRPGRPRRSGPATRRAWSPTCSRSAGAE